MEIDWTILYNYEWIAVLTWIASLAVAYGYGRKSMWDEHIEEIVKTQLKGGPNMDLDAGKPGYSVEDEDEESKQESTPIDIE